MDLNPFFPSAWREAFSSPVVGCFNPQTLIASSVGHLVDFYKVSMEDLRTFEIPLDWTIRNTGLMHGIGGWFDLEFQPPAPSETLSSSGDTTDDDDIMADMPAASTSEKKAQDTDVAYSGLSVSAPPFKPAGDVSINVNPDGLASGTANDTAAALLAAAMAANPDAGAGAGSSAGLALPPVSVSGDPTESTNSNTSFMSTSPFCAPTHWQQARLLLPEPLAVNRGQKVKGWMKFAVNENRSYDIDAEIWLVDPLRAGGGSGSDAEGAGKDKDKGKTSGGTTSDTRAGNNDKSTRRRWKWKLDRQSYSWTTAS